LQCRGHFYLLAGCGNTDWILLAHYRVLWTW
jgi:hypothetical protein